MVFAFKSTKLMGTCMQEDETREVVIKSSPEAEKAAYLVSCCTTPYSLGKKR